ncbi:hypothetical protein MKQ70_18630 [Chitinophaga sedimenti]|uniref:hypothetical protein n=1 Tax=Chitinophaga sedimenti TaxID=2033606 RepID=UPI00200321AB|nr:hypothetical protein [Chitinophaga sedimenti]MCK7556920.1 hypothetical protein [Chitinophaga sedimenti]
MNKASILVIALFNIAITASAQLRWKPSDRHNAGLPSTIRVYETTDSLDGKAFRAFYLEADLYDPKLDVYTRVGNGKRYTPSQYAEQEGALAVVNTTFFSFADNSNLNIVMHKGKVLANNPKGHYLKRSATDSVMVYPTRGAFGIDKRGNADVAGCIT